MEQMPPQGQPPQSQPSPEGNGGAATLVARINTDLMKLSEMVAEKSPEAAQQLAQVAEAYQAVISQMQGGGEGEGRPEQEGPSPLRQKAPAMAGGREVRPAM